MSNFSQQNLTPETLDGLVAAMSVMSGHAFSVDAMAEAMHKQKQARQPFPEDGIMDKDGNFIPCETTVRKGAPKRLQ
jgi:hypothetical protein